MAEQIKVEDFYNSTHEISGLSHQAVHVPSASLPPLASPPCNITHPLTSVVFTRPLPTQTKPVISLISALTNDPKHDGNPTFLAIQE